MTDATLSPSAVELFHQWKELREGGSDTATFVSRVSADTGALATELERLIDGYLAGGVAASTLLGGSPSAGPPPNPPVIPGYEIEGYLGGGGMGQVWRVRDRLNRPLALKLVRADRMSAAARERFRAEGLAMAHLTHPHLAPIHHFDVHEDRPYFTMESYPASLKDRLTEFQADPKAAVRLMAAVAAGVGHLHDRGYVHRDLKPGNVLLAEDGTPKVSDFGLVKSLTEDSSPGDPWSVAGGSGETFPTGPRRSKTVAGAVLGTRAYMSPEQAAGQSDQSNPRWDVWALGVMLHELLTGRLPPSSAAPERLLEPDAEENPPPSSFKPGLDPRLERIVRKCLAREETERYADGAAVAAELARGLSAASRRRICVVCASITVLIVVATWAALGGFFRAGDPADIAFRRDREALRANGEVRIDPAARIKNGGYRMLGSGEPETPRYDSQVDGISVATTESTLLLLLDDPGIPAYRFEAEISQRLANPSSRGGIFHGLRAINSLDGPRLNFVGYTINLHSNGSNGVRAVRAYSQLLPDPGAGRPYPTVSNTNLSVGPMTADPAGEERWVKLAAEVRSGRLTWFLPDGTTAAVTNPPPAHIQDQIRTQARPADDETVDLPAAGGLGFYVHNSSACFRNIIIRALADE